MYLSLGEKVVRAADVVGVFDLDKTSVGRDTKAFLKKAEERGKVTAAFADLPVSFVLMKDGEVILTSLSPKTVEKQCKM